MRIETAVRAYQSVVAEIIVGRVIVIEVTAVGVELSAVFLMPAQALVNEIPDEASLEFRVLADEVPVLLEATFGVAHCVSILDENQRLDLGLVLAVFLNLVVRKIHMGIEIGLSVVLCPFVLDYAAGVNSLHEVVCLLEVLAVASLVAERPADDGRMVVVCSHIALVALKMGLGIVIAVSEALVAITHSVGLDISLCNYVETVFVAELIPIAVVRIVAGAHCIDIVLLHNGNVLKHTLAAYHITSVRVNLVAVHTLEVNRLAVYEHKCSADFHFAEADLYRHYF